MKKVARLLSVLPFLVTVPAVTLALAQPKAKPPKPAKPAPSAGLDAGAPPPEETVQGEGGVPAPPPADLPDGQTKLSPLNPEKVEFPQPQPEGGTAVPVDYDKLMADIAALRARVSAVGDALYKSRLAVTVETDGDRMKVSRFVVLLDDGVVYTAPPNFRAEDSTLVYEHAVAPGRHSVTVEVDRKDTRDEAFRSSQRSRFVVDVPRDHRLEVNFRVVDDSTMGADFGSDRSGRYDARVRMKAQARPAGK